MPGDVVGQMGSTGSLSGSHLHFEIREGKYVSNEHFWNRGVVGAGRYPNAIDPLEVYKEDDETEKIINATQSNPELWFNFFEEMKNHLIGKVVTANDKECLLKASIIGRL